jgi:hypothetical protein
MTLLRGSPPERGRALWVAVLVGVAAAGCSVLLDTNAEQCQSDRDCARFPNAACDLVVHLCVPVMMSVVHPPDASANDGADTAATAACHDETGCIPCADGGPTPLEACTASKCISFDNHARLQNLGPDGKLTPLP